MQISGRFNVATRPRGARAPQGGQNFEHFIIKAIRDYFGGDNKIQIVISKKEFSEKRELLGEVKHYYVEMGSRSVKSAIFTHFSEYPLLGHKKVTYSQ